MVRRAAAMVAVARVVEGVAELVMVRAAWERVEKTEEPQVAVPRAAAMRVAGTVVAVWMVAATGQETPVAGLMEAAG